MPKHTLQFLQDNYIEYQLLATESAGQKKTDRLVEQEMVLQHLACQLADNPMVSTALTTLTLDEGIAWAAWYVLFLSKDDAILTQGLGSLCRSRTLPDPDTLLAAFSFLPAGYKARICQHLFALSEHSQNRNAAYWLFVLGGIDNNEPVLQQAWHQLKEMLPLSWEEMALMGQGLVKRQDVQAIRQSFALAGTPEAQEMVIQWGLACRDPIALQWLKVHLFSGQAVSHSLFLFLPPGLSGHFTATLDAMSDNQQKADYVRWLQSYGDPALMKLFLHQLSGEPDVRRAAHQGIMVFIPPQSQVYAMAAALDAEFDTEAGPPTAERLVGFWRKQHGQVSRDKRYWQHQLFDIDALLPVMKWHPYRKQVPLSVQALMIWTGHYFHFNVYAPLSQQLQQFDDMAQRIASMPSIAPGTWLLWGDNAVKYTDSAQ